MEIVIAALDVTGCAEEVVPVAVRLARGVGARLVLLNTWQLPSSVPRSLNVAGDTAAHTLEQDARDHLELLAGGPRSSGLHVTVLIREGPAASTILAVAKELSASWLVLGTHARTGLARWVLGSVAEQVVRHASIPVVTVRAQHPEDEPGLSEAQLAISAESDG